jgi:hypothetical protein
MPWESVRADRQLRLFVIATLVQKQYLWSEEARAIYKWCEKRQYNYCFFDAGIGWQWRYSNAGSPMSEWALCTTQLQRTFQAMKQWYKEHDNTLPESLDELVEGHYLDEFPGHPFKEEPVTYHRNAPVPKNVRRDGAYGNARYNNFSVCFLDGSMVEHRSWNERQKQERKAYDDFEKSGGTYIQLGGWHYLIVEPSAEEESEDE